MAHQMITQQMFARRELLKLGPWSKTVHHRDDAAKAFRQLADEIQAGEVAVTTVDIGTPVLSRVTDGIVYRTAVFSFEYAVP